MGHTYIQTNLHTYIETYVYIYRERVIILKTKIQQITTHPPKNVTLKAAGADGVV